MWAWNSDRILDILSSRISSRAPSTPARKNTFVWPSLQIKCVSVECVESTNTTKTGRDHSIYQNTILIPQVVRGLIMLDFLKEKRTCNHSDLTAMLPAPSPLQLSRPRNLAGWSWVREWNIWNIIKMHFRIWNKYRAIHTYFCLKHKKILFHVNKYLCLNSEYIMRFGKPLRQIRIPSSTPLHCNWCRTRWASISPAMPKIII